MLAGILCQYSPCFVLLLDLSTYLGFKVYKLDTSRARLLEKRLNYFWNTCKELIQKKKKKNLNIQSILPKVFLKNTVSESPF